MEDNWLECPRCGANIYLEHTRCPRCGLNLYPEDGEESGLSLGENLEEAENEGVGFARVFWGLVMGWMVGGTVTFVIHILVKRGLNVPEITQGWLIVLWLSGPLGAGVAGYISTMLVRRSGWAAIGVGMLAGMGVFALTILLETLWRLVTLQVLLEPARLAALALCAALGVVMAWFAGRQSSGMPFAGKAPATGMGWEDLMYQDLLSRVRHRRETADRLIEYERRLAPDADRYTLIRNAVERLDRDRQ